MCVSPILIKNPSKYFDFNLHSAPSRYEVPCGKCLECRNVMHSEWQTRISFEISDLYARGGKAIFLTFTYNDSCLPHLRVLNRPEIPCFSHDDVLRFLNKIKVFSNRTFGKGAYKYFFTSEYGSYTKRPHYHALFFLEKNVNEVVFAEKCREYWNYGFMFPKRRGNNYVDNYGNVSSILIRSLAGGAKYVSKYVTKDLSYFDDELVKQVLKPYYEEVDSDVYCLEGALNVEYITSYRDVYPAQRFKKCMPKHWQSKGLGSSLVVGKSEEKCVEYLTKGVFNPLTQKVVPCPSYVINKLMYRNVVSQRVNADGKPLYDRFLSDFGKKYYFLLFDSKVKANEERLRSFASTYLQYRSVLADMGLSLLDVQDIINKCGDLHKVAVWSVAYRFAHISEIQCSIMLHDGDFDAPFVDDVAYNFYLSCHDTETFRKYPPLKFDVYNLDTINYRLVCYESLYSIFKACTCEVRYQNYFMQDFINKGIEKLKRFYAKYDTSLC